MISQTDLSASTPALHGRFSLQWEALAKPLSDEERFSLEYENENTLRSCFLLDERAQDVSDERDGASQEATRIEQRLNLVIELLGFVLARSDQRPTAVPCVISRASIEWHGADAPPPRQAVKVSIHLHPYFPSPVVLCGTVREVDRGASVPRIMVSLDQLSEPVAEWLDRIIFRAHRRAIALSKRGR